MTKFISGRTQPRPPAVFATPYLQLPPLKALQFTLQWQALGLLALVMHVILIGEGSIAWFVLLMAGLFALHRSNPLAGFVVYVQLLLYQNVVVSIFSAHISRSDYTAISATSFVAGLILASGPLLRLASGRRAFHSRQQASQVTMRRVLLALAVVLAYTALGAVSAGIVPALLGFRAATAMLFAMIIGLDLGDRWGFRTVATCFVISAALGVGLAVVEVSNPAWYLAQINATDYFNMKNYPSVRGHLFGPENVVDSMTALPFNTGALQSLIQGTVYRFAGPNMHPISYGYVLSITTLLLLSLGHLWLALPMVVLLLLIGVKGALILFVTASLLFMLWQFSASLPILLACGVLLTTAYVGYGVRTGLEDGDFHVLGLIGGVNGFINNPLGHGIGVGGNMSLGTLAETKWQKFQAAGAADVGLESAIGVLIYQMGIGCAALVAAILALLRGSGMGLRWRRPKRTDLLFVALCMGLVNGVFQEEAYSPYALGLLALFSAVLVANTQRPSREIETV